MWSYKNQNHKRDQLKDNKLKWKHPLLFCNTKQNENDIHMGS